MVRVRWDGDQSPLAPERWRELLPGVGDHPRPAADRGYLAGDHVRLRDRLGVLTRSLAEELAADQAERQAWLDNLRRRGAADGNAVEEETAGAAPLPDLDPSRLLCVALTDAVGDRLAQNQPGTIDEYPNWRVPLSGPDGTPMLLEDVLASRRACGDGRGVTAPVRSRLVRARRLTRSESGVS